MAGFDDGKDEGALRTIGEIGTALGIKAHVLRYWEQQFPMLKPLKRSGGRRYYRAEDVALVRTIDRLVNREGYTIKGARAAIGNAAGAGSAAVRTDKGGGENRPAAATDASLLDRLKAIRADLARALAN